MSVTSPIENLSRRRDAFLNDGVVLLKDVFGGRDLAYAKKAFRLEHCSSDVSRSALLSAARRNFLSGFVQRRIMAFLYQVHHRERPPFLGCKSVGYPKHVVLFEQIFLKSGDGVRRTPWHQDSPYLPVDGKQFAVVWMSLDPVGKNNALEFVPGSHLHNMSNPTSFDAQDDTDPFIEEGTLPRIPDIEANREVWKIVSWATGPADAIVFHPGILHGGAATASGARRRTLSLRFLGDGVTFGDRPKPKAGTNVGVDKDGKPKRDMSGVYAGFKPGDSFRPKSLIKLRGP